MYIWTSFLHDLEYFMVFAQHALKKIVITYWNDEKLKVELKTTKKSFRVSMHMKQQNFLQCWVEENVDHKSLRNKALFY